MNLSSAVKITEAVATTATGTSTINGAAVDMEGFDGVIFIAKLSSAAADNNMKAQQDVVSGMGGAADLAGSLTGNGASDEILWLDIHKPREQFVRPVILRGTTTVIEWVVAIQYTGSKQPVSNVLAGTIYGEVHDSPAEGTA